MIDELTKAPTLRSNLYLRQKGPALLTEASMAEDESVSREVARRKIVTGLKSGRIIHVGRIPAIAAEVVVYYDKRMRKYVTARSIQHAIIQKHGVRVSLSEVSRRIQVGVRLGYVKPASLSWRK